MSVLNKTVIRLVLGDQLNIKHSWFDRVDNQVVYIMMEIRQETDYVLHHAQKILAIFAAMRDFAKHLKQAGHRVHYFTIDDDKNSQSLSDNLTNILKFYQASRFEYQLPDEWRLDQQLKFYCKELSIEYQPVNSEHFYTTRGEAARLFADKQHWLMESFYRHLRIKHNILIDSNLKPVGGQWNYDHDNRKPWKGTPEVPEDFRTTHDHSELWKTIINSGVKSFGQPHANQCLWPLNRQEALHQLDLFIDTGLPHFGDFQDAMSSKEPRLFHSLLSFALNTKMLAPQEVIEKAQQALKKKLAPLSAVEGFIRQILGWREYIRGVYWAKMPTYTQQNTFNFDTPLPAWFWSGKTNMRCLSQSIGQSLEHAHAHHIQRLMIIGNFALLAELNPFEVHQWYLGVYVDAFEWVEAPNTLGISQFADDGLSVTKPYVSSAAYIDRMSDYCKNCTYQKKLRVEKDACPFNALYWSFFHRHRDRFSTNHRLSMIYKQLEKMDADVLRETNERAQYLLSHLNAL